MLAPMADVAIEALQRVPLLSKLDKKELKSMSREMSERTFPQGAEVTATGKSGVGFFIIDAGTATVRVGDRVVASLKAGDHFGEMALIDGGRRSAQVTADTELTCYGMTAWNFRPFLKDHPDLVWALLQTLVARLREAEAR
jgi:CRP-like cAMP-binding protein